MRPKVVVRVDEWQAVEEIAGLLRTVPELRQNDGKIVEVFEDGHARYIPSAKLRHFICVACDLTNEQGKPIHPTTRLVNGVLNLGSYPGLGYFRF